MEIKVKGCLYEDKEALKIFMHAQDMCSAMWEIRNMVRTRIKHCEHVSDEEEVFLEQIMGELCIPGLEE